MHPNCVRVSVATGSVTWSPSAADVDDVPPGEHGDHEEDGNTDGDDENQQSPHLPIVNLRLIVSALAGEAITSPPRLYLLPERA